MSHIIIPLTRNQTASISSEDSDLANLKWHASYNHSSKLYYARRLPRSGIVMHRVVLERMLDRPLTQNEFCDHINGDTLDNRRCNLRVATKSQNGMNRKINCNNKSGFKGVRYHNRDKCYYAQITANGVKKHLGTFDTPEQAYDAYCKAALELHGEFARLK